MKYLRWLLLPFSLLYGLAVIVRNWCYDAGVFKSYKFTKPIISVGNLDVGGAGKSPMTEYLIRLLKDNYKLATLSRGYGRETKGYLVAVREPADVSIGMTVPTVPHGIVETSGTPGTPGTAVPGTSEASPLTTHHAQLTTHHSPLTTHHPPLTIAAQIGDEPAQFKHKFPDITVAVCEDRVSGINKLLPPS